MKLMEETATDSDWDHGKEARIGVVPYLNVQPLTWAFRLGPMCELPMRLFAHPPRELARRLTAGEFDVAIVPVMEYLLRPTYSIVPGVSIACYGAVKSVILYSSVEIEDVTTIYLDPASLTSVNLLRVLMAERGLRMNYGELAAPGAAVQPFLKIGEAQLLIGDSALREYNKHPLQYDLGQMWLELTELPFVFAPWLVHPSAAQMSLTASLKRAKEIGCANLRVVAEEAAARHGFDPDFTLRYFEENMNYELGERELAGIGKFAELCAKHGLIDAVPKLRMHER